MKEERLLTILRRPITTEKTNMVATRSQQIVFEIATDATKPEVKEAIEKEFKVRVQSVQVVNVKGKKKKSPGTILGKRRDRRKAYVRLHREDDIDFSQTSPSD